MKKTLLSLAVVGTLLGSTNLMASDSTALTKAVVKLIKANQALEGKVGGVDKYSEINANGVAKNVVDISKLDSDLKNTNKAAATLSSTVNNNKMNISDIQKKIGAIEVKADSAEKTAIETKNLVEEMRGMSNQFKTQSSNVVSSAKTAFKKSTIAEEKINILSKAVRDVSASSKINANAIKDLEAKLGDLNKSFDSYKMSSSQKTEELESQLASIKVYFEAEIKILKAKLDRARPVYVLDKEVAATDCTSGKCEGSEDINKVISDFIK